MSDTSTSLWHKVDFDLESGRQSGRETRDADELAEARARRRRAFRVLDAVGVVLWAYGLLKVFVADIDRELLGEFADYRFFVFLAGLTALAFVFRSPIKFVGALIYLVLFPAIVLCWKLPWALLPD